MSQKKSRRLIWDIVFLLTPVFTCFFADFVALLTGISNIEFVLLRPLAMIVSFFLPLYKAIGVVIETKMAEVASGTITPWIIWFVISYLIGIVRRGRYWTTQKIA